MILYNMSMEGSLFYVKKGLPTVDGDFAVLYSKNPYYISKDKLDNAYYVPKKMCGISIEDDSGKYVKVLICGKVGWIHDSFIRFI